MTGLEKVGPLSLKKCPHWGYLGRDHKSGVEWEYAARRTLDSQEFPDAH